MLIKTKGIFLHQIKYSETSLIAKIYTREAGIQSFLIKGAKRKKPAQNYNTLQTAGLLDLILLKNNKSTLNTLKEFNLLNQLSSIHSNILKSSIALFMAEIIYKSIKEEESNQQLFDFLENSILSLELKEDSLVAFPASFLIYLSRYLGYDVREELIVNGNNETRLSQEAVTFINNCPPPQNTSIEYQMPSIKIKKEVLTFLIEYFEKNLMKSGEIKSYKVLETVLN